MATPTVITFDVYGKLTQWDETVTAAFREVPADRGSADADLELVCGAFEAESRRLQTVAAFRSYRGILRDSVRPALATASLTPSERDIAAVLDRLSWVPPCPKAPGILAGLTRQYRLCSISNTDDDFLASTLEGLGPVFATTVTAEQARAYKPNPGLLRFALRKLGLEAGSVLHVAHGTFSDLAVCTALGIRVVWLNRKGTTLQDGLEPVAIIDDLSALPDILAAESRSC